MNSVNQGCSGKELGLVLCHDCKKTSKITVTHCPRCGSRLHLRQPFSLQRSWALLIAAVVLLFPANVYPISYTIVNGVRQPDTIISGVIALAKADMVPIAIIVFIASVAVPLLKILGLLVILIAVHFNAQLRREQRLKLYHMIHFIGRWSMIDLFVITIMSALLNVGILIGFTAGPAATAFGLVVILTMFATQSFDTRLIWDHDSTPTSNALTQANKNNEEENDRANLSET